MQLPYLQTFIIGNRLLARAPRNGEEIDARIYPPSSFMFFCSICGDIYARFPVMEAASGKLLPWQCWKGCCTRCRQPYTIPGSIWCSWEKELLRILPREVLQHELINTINYILEEKNGN